MSYPNARNTGESLRPRAKSAAAPCVPGPLHPMIATKLWDNPCWLSFRVNYIAHHFNQPIYEWIWQTYKVTAPEHVVLYAIGLRDGVTADDVAASSAKPKNTLSRAVNALIAKRLVTRVQDTADRRRMRLYLTRQGRKIVDETVPVFVSHEHAMFAALTVGERKSLKQLLTKIVVNHQAWPTRINPKGLT
jgi:MarR family transcriptional regulator, temperature-dependent positive regulator of motility